MTEALPWLSLLAILAVAAWRRDPRDRARSGWRVAFARSAAALLVLWALVANGAGALSERGKHWCMLPASVDAEPARIWNWSDPQVLAWLAPRKTDRGSE